MTRKADQANRSQLLDRIVDYALSNGVASLSLRPLAKELGVSAGSLLYHFGSKEELTVEILKHAGDRQRDLVGSMQLRENASTLQICRDFWRIISSPDVRPLFRLFFEVYGLALIDRTRFPGFFPGAVANWLEFLERSYLRRGMSRSRARTRATVILAGFRGFLLDLCATDDAKRLDRAVELWLERLP